MSGGLLYICHHTSYYQLLSTYKHSEPENTPPSHRTGSDLIGPLPVRLGSEFINVLDGRFVLVYINKLLDLKQQAAEIKKLRSLFLSCSECL